MRMRGLLTRLGSVAAVLVLPCESMLLAQSQPQAAPTDEAASTDEAAIVVTGNREKQAAAAAVQAKVITQKPSGDVPLPRHYAALCVITFGIDPAYGELLAQRVTDNARLLGLAVGGPKCSPNVWIGFITNSKAEVAKLKTSNPEMFAELKRFEIDRIFGGSGAAQVWHSTEQRSVDGKPIAYTTINGRAVKTNPQYQTGRTISPVRTDINGSLVIFDRARANGLTVLQLADYATMRILAPVQDIARVEPGTVPSILTLFAVDSDSPGGLTEFDWSYLSAFYRLGRGAKAASISDATERAMLDGRGGDLRARSVPASD